MAQLTDGETAQMYKRTFMIEDQFGPYPRESLNAAGTDRRRGAASPVAVAEEREGDRT
jgi:hypothetical protein